MGESNLELAARKVCRNPGHLPQIVALLNGSLGERSGDLSVEQLVDHWWRKQLFLGIDLKQVA
jgi:hypothetical protein